MKILSVIVPAIALLLAACTPAAGLPTSEPPVPAATQPASTPTVGVTPVEPDMAQQAAIASLAQSLGIAPDQVKVDSAEAVTWPDGCLGVQRLGVMCTQGLVPGYRYLLSAHGKQYEVHTNLDGSVVVPVQAMQSPGTAQSVAITQLARNLGIPESEVKLVSSAAVEWPDSCLGVAMERMMCAQIVTPGYLITLEAGGRQYEYHTDQNAGHIVPARPAFDWKEEGGIGGVCKELTVFLSGEVYGMDCSSGGSDGRMRVLSAAERARLYAWIDQLANTSIDLSDPQGAADAMTRTADLMSTGSQPARDSEKHEIFDFGTQLFSEMFH